MTEHNQWHADEAKRLLHDRLNRLYRDRTWGKIAIEIIVENGVAKETSCHTIERYKPAR